MSSEARLRIVKLDDNNYPEWKGDITGALMSASLNEFIDPEAEPPPEPEGLVSREQKVTYDLYVMRQRKAAGIMFSHMTQQYRIIVESEGFIYQPLKIWLLMKEKFQATTSSSKVGKLPNLMEMTISLFNTKRPLKTKVVLDVMDSYLVDYNERHRRDNATASATIANRPQQPARCFPYPTCLNGRHNPAVRGHKPEQCYQAFPEL
ncbi:uncharacterized protein MELLADRAFT_110547 [Melampsora larici-populina 98AG31]|uniref:Retrotransposon Copia-like N-terminal domain-containing protein n=1 Tax=Melampsora larici-populina (strain 98AG31 / pathotype 3-4-7) TaxID=747676 RepID=F4S062_MELLP|nr:uncharacterized protein MELLADRAFT_110547 [Melampsora larici-populina 98AG31]EGG01992.1 hypothetical protein MELLADRAFT_110547 [Melampsora larici-populina 98AG31]